jgi:hypothetical protein
MAEVWLGPGWAEPDPFLGQNSREAVVRGSGANWREIHDSAAAAGATSEEGGETILSRLGLHASAPHAGDHFRKLARI